MLSAREEFAVAGGAGSSDVASVDRRLVKLYAAWGKPDRAQALKTAHPKP